MKRLFTLLFVILITLAAFAQAPKSVLYLTTPVPFASGDNLHDQEMFDILTDLGYLVTPEQISATSSTSGYDVIFTSEAIPSGDGGWPNYASAPLPMVMAKVWAVREGAMAWVAGQNSGTDYGNSADSIFVVVDDEHPLNCNLPDRFSIVHSGSTESDIGAFVNFSVENPSGVNVVYSTELSADQHTVVDVDAFTSLNGNTLQNRVVILGIHQIAYDEINAHAIQLIDNCLQYAVDGEVDCGGGGTSINDQKITIVNVFPNPSIDGNFHLKLNRVISSAQVTVVALDGRTVRSVDMYNFDSIDLDLSDLSNGIYIVNINGSDINYSREVSLQK